jgi:hypothetical protein
MADETFEQNLLRMLAGTLHFLTTLTAAREMFGRSYFSLGVSEKAIVDQAVVAQAAGNFQVITPEFLATQQAAAPVGFHSPATKQSAESS